MDKMKNILGKKTPEQIISAQRILDNIMVSVFFEHNSKEAKEALQEILCTLLDDPELVVDEYHIEHVLSNIGHRGIRIDVWARDGRGRQLALELQKVTDEEVYPRAVFEGATMVVHSLSAGESYSKLDKTVVIFFTMRDLEGKGEPLYLYESTLEGIVGKMTAIAPSYLFVNGTYRNDQTELGRLIADIMERDPTKMQTAILRDRMDMLKNTREGREKMEDALEKYVLESNRTMLMHLVQKGKLTVAEAAEEAGMTTQEFQQCMLELGATTVPSIS